MVAPDSLSRGRGVLTAPRYARIAPEEVIPNAPGGCAAHAGFPHGSTSSSSLSFDLAIGRIVKETGRQWPG